MVVGTPVVNMSSTASSDVVPSSSIFREWGSDAPSTKSVGTACSRVVFACQNPAPTEATYQSLSTVAMAVIKYDPRDRNGMVQDGQNRQSGKMRVCLYRLLAALCTFFTTETHTRESTSQLHRWCMAECELFLAALVGEVGVVNTCRHYWSTFRLLCTMQAVHGFTSLDENKRNKCHMFRRRVERSSWYFDSPTVYMRVTPAFESFTYAGREQI